MQSVKQGGIKYHFLSLWYDSTWDWNTVSQTIDKHSTYKANIKTAFRSPLSKENKKDHVIPIITLSFTIDPYRPPLVPGLLDGIQWPHIIDYYKSLLVSQ